METLNKHIHLHIVPMYFLLCFSLSQCAFIVLKVVNIIKKFSFQHFRVNDSLLWPKVESAP